MTRLTILMVTVVLTVATRAPAELMLQQVGTGFSQPLFLTAALGDTNPNQVYVVQKGGLVRTLDAGTGTIGATPFLNLPSILGAGQLPPEANKVY